MRTLLSLVIVLGLVAPDVALAATPAEQRMHVARELQSIFDGSLVKGFDLKFIVRGKQCDVLQVEGYVNLTQGMMQALANGTLIYGRVLPGGVNQFAFQRTFRAVAYTNAEDPEYAFFGNPALTRKQVRQMRQCTDTIAASLTGAEPVAKPPSPPPFEPLSWSTARKGTKLYDGAFKHEATIVRVNRAEGLIEVRYVRSGTVEPKLLDAVARFWYVHK